jgi:hypothetical protein
LESKLNSSILCNNSKIDPASFVNIKSFFNKSESIVIATCSNGNLIISEILEKKLIFKEMIQISKLIKTFKLNKCSVTNNALDNYFNYSQNDHSETLVCIGIDVFILPDYNQLYINNKLIDSSSIVIVYATNSSIIFIDYYFHNIIDILDLPSLQMPQMVEFTLNSNNQSINAAILSIFENKINILTICDIKNVQTTITNQNENLNEQIITVFPK